MVTYDLDGVLVGADRTVGTESEELALGCARFHDGDLLLERERLECDVVHYADCESVLWLRQFQILIYGNDL